MGHVGITTGAILMIAIALESGCAGGCADDVQEVPVTSKPEPEPEPAVQRDEPEQEVAAAPPVAPQPASPQPAPVPATPSTKSEPASFRARVLRDMGAVLGQPPSTHQDAINAIYRKIGWQSGTAPTAEQNEEAYDQALAWGVTLGKLARSGRATPFGAEEIASEPLVEAQLQNADTSSPKLASQARRPARAPTALPSETPTQKASDEAPDEAAERAAKLARLNAQVDRLGNDTRALDQQVHALEQAAQKPAVSPSDARSIEQRSENLKQRAGEAETLANSIESEVERASQD